MGGWKQLKCSIVNDQLSMINEAAPLTDDLSLKIEALPVIAGKTTTNHTNGTNLALIS
jgi:hypothetical protein